MMWRDERARMDEMVPLDLKRWLYQFPRVERVSFQSSMSKVLQHGCTSRCTRYLHVFLALRDTLVSIKSANGEPSDVLRFLTFWLAHELVVKRELEELMKGFDDSSLLHLLFRCWYWTDQGERELVNEYIGDMLALKDALVREFSPVNVQFIIQVHEIIISTRFAVQDFEGVRKYLAEERSFIEEALGRIEDAEAWSYWRWHPRIHEMRLALITKGPWEAKKAFHEWEDDVEECSFDLLSAHVFNTIGTVYMVAGELDEAITWFERAVAVGKETGFIRSAVPAQSNLADIYFLLGRIKTAIVMGKEALEGFKYTETPFNEFLQLMSLITFYMADDDQEGATKTWHRALALMKRETSLDLPMFKAFLLGRAMELGIMESELPPELVADVRAVLESEERLGELDPHARMMFMECRVNQALRDGNLGLALEEVEKVINACFEFNLLMYAWQFTLKKLEILINLAQVCRVNTRGSLLHRALSMFDDLSLYEDLQRRPLMRLKLAMARLALSYLVGADEGEIERGRKELRALKESIIKSSATRDELTVNSDMVQYLEFLLEKRSSFLSSLSNLGLDVVIRDEIFDHLLYKIVIRLLAKLSRIPVAHSKGPRQSIVKAVLIQSMTGLNYFSLVNDEKIDPDLFSGFIAALQTMSSSFTGEVGLLTTIRHERFIIDFVPIMKHESFLTVFLDADDPIIRHRLRQLAKDLLEDARITSYLNANFVKHEDEMTALIQKKVERALGDYLQLSEEEDEEEP